MSDPYLGEIRLMSFDFAPLGWAQCNGQLMPINQNQALFAVLGVAFGGNGQTTFALPDMRGRVPIHRNGNHIVGQAGGAAAHTLTAGEMPAHSHALNSMTLDATARSPQGALPAYPREDMYSASASDIVAAAPEAIASAGASQPHNNMQPYLTVNFCMALQGVFPS